MAGASLGAGSKRCPSGRLIWRPLGTQPSASLSHAALACWSSTEPWLGCLRRRQRHGQNCLAQAMQGSSCCASPPSRALPAGGEKRLVEGSPARLHRLDVVRLTSGLRRDRFARFGPAGRVIRAGHGDMESKRCALLATWPGLRPMVRRCCRGDEAPGLRILPHPHTMVRPQRIGASHRTRRRRRDGHGRWRGYLVVFNLTESCVRFLAFRSSRMRCPNV